MSTRRIALISTGGTIEKTYNPLSGILDNKISVLELMLSKLRLSGITLDRVMLMNKDSLKMTTKDHTLIALTVEMQLEDHDGVVVVHGTDTLELSGQACFDHLKDLDKPVVFTGAMRPYELRTTDALQNLTEALLAVQLLSGGVYLSMHNQVLSFPGVTKDRENVRFVKRKDPIS